MAASGKSQKAAWNTSSVELCYARNTDCFFNCLELCPFVSIGKEMHCLLLPEGFLLNKENERDPGIFLNSQTGSASGRKGKK